MRILFCVNRDFMSNIALNYLRNILYANDCSIILSSGIGNAASPKAPEIELWQKHEKQLVERELFLSLENYAHSNQNNIFRTFDQLAKATMNKKILEFASINSGEGLEYIQNFLPDIIISIRFGQIFKETAIKIPKFGILNLHSGILPDYRGVLATFWAMLHKQSHIGCTLHYVTDGTIDTGEIIGINKLEINKKRSLLWNIAALYEGGTEMISNAIASISSNKILSTVPQDSSKSNYFSYPKSEDIQQFIDQGNVLYTENDYLELFKLYGVER